MLDEFDRRKQELSIRRLAGVPKTRVEAVLIGRGVDTTSIDDTVQSIDSIGIPFTPEQIIRKAFAPRDSDPSFGVGRFGDGSSPVLYSAIDEDTCVEEIKYHLRRQFNELANQTFPFPRHYCLISLVFNGEMLLLSGHEHKYPDLISETEAGYPFCRRLAQNARSGGVQGLNTPSARNRGGTCVPIFEESTLSNIQEEKRVVFTVEAGAIVRKIAD